MDYSYNNINNYYYKLDFNLLWKKRNDWRIKWKQTIKRRKIAFGIY